MIKDTNNTRMIILELHSICQINIHRSRDCEKAYLT